MFRIPFALLLYCTIGFSQHTYDVTAKWNNSNTPLDITQDIVWTNTSNVAVDVIYLLDWNHGYSSEVSPLGKFLANEYDYKLIRASKQNRGSTSITKIAHRGNALSWNREKEQLDVIKVALPYSVPAGKKFNFTLRYSVQLPDAAIFKYGVSKNELFSYNWHVMLADLNDDGSWNLNSNLGFGFPNTPYVKTTYNINANSEVRVLLPNEKTQGTSPLLVSEKKIYKEVPFGKSTLLTDMLPKSGMSNEINEALEDVTSFINNSFPDNGLNTLWALQTDYNQQPLLMLESIPQILKAFSVSQTVELKILKTLLDQLVWHTFGPQHDDSKWMITALPYFLWQQYVDTKYPNLKLIGTLSELPFIKNYHFAKAPYYRSWEIAANVAANKTRGQALVTPQENQTGYNRRVAYPDRGALALLYLNDYLGDSILIDAFKQLSKTKTLDIDLQKKLNTSGKPIDWFFEHYVKENNNGDFVIKGVKTDKSNYTLTIGSTKKNVVIPLTTTSSKNEKTTIWLNKNDLPYIKTFDKNQIASVTLNEKHYVPELSLNNNSYNLNRALFRNNLRLRLLQDIPESGTAVLLASPEFGYNIYDGLLAGITIGNSSMLSNSLRFRFSPQYGLKSQKINGMSYAIVNLYHEKNAHYLTRFTLFGTSYHYATQKRYTAFTPSVQFFYRPKGIQNKHRTNLSLRHVSVQLQDLPKNDERRSYGVNVASFQSKSGDALQNWYYKTELQSEKSFKKISAESQYTTYYAPNRRFTLRLFAGSFLKNDTNDDYYNFNASRVNDYLFQYDLYGRSENEGFFSQQYIKAEGGMRTSGSVKGANEWLITAQTSTTLWRWIESYAEVGWIKNSNKQTNTHWGTGISFNIIPDFFEIHFPMYDSTGNLMIKKAYPKQIRFQLSLRPSALAQLFSQSWF